MQLSGVPGKMIDIDAHPFSGPQIVDLIAKKALTNIPAKYANFLDIFSPTLGSITILSNWSMSTDLSDYLSHL